MCTAVYKLAWSDLQLTVHVRKCIRLKSSMTVLPDVLFNSSR